MSGIFYDPEQRRVHIVRDAPEPKWQLVTHDTQAGAHQCRRILREWVGESDLVQVDWSSVERRSA